MVYRVFRCCHYYRRETLPNAQETEHN
jgi:hypothetical protein